MLYELIDGRSGKESIPINTLVEILTSLYNHFYNILYCDNKNNIEQPTDVTDGRSNHHPVLKFNCKYSESFTSFEYSTKIEIMESSVSTNSSASGKIILEI